MATTLDVTEMLPTKRIGIYAIFNTVKNRIYVGSAVNIKRRYSEHKKLLIENRHSNKFLQNDFNQQNQKFQFQILEMVDDSKNLINTEQQWINKYYDNQNTCYNICPTTGNHLGMKHSQETKNKMSTSSKGKKKSLEHSQKIKEIKQLTKGIVVYQYSIAGELVAKFPSMKEAAKIIKLQQLVLIHVLKTEDYPLEQFLVIQK